MLINASRIYCTISPTRDGYFIFNLIFKKNILRAEKQHNALKDSITNHRYCSVLKTICRIGSILTGGQFVQGHDGKSEQN